MSQTEGPFVVSAPDEEATSVHPSTSSSQELSSNPTLAASAPAAATSTNGWNPRGAKRVQKKFSEEGLNEQIFLVKYAKWGRSKDADKLILEFLEILKELPNDKIERVLEGFQNDDDKNFCAITDYLVSRLGFWKKLKFGMEDGPLSIAFYVALLIAGATLYAYFK